MLISLGASILTFLTLQFASIKHKPLSELKWNKQYLQYQNRLTKLIKNKYYLSLFFFSTVSQSIIFLVFLLFVYSVAEFKVNQPNNLISGLIFTLCVSLLTFILLSQTGSQTIRKFGLSKILSFIPSTIAIGTLFCLSIGYLYSFSGYDVTYIRFFIVCNIFTIVSISYTYGFQTTGFITYFTPIDIRQKNSIDNIVNGYGTCIVLAITSGLGYFIINYPIAFEFISEHSQIPISLGLLIIFGCLILHFSFKNLHQEYTSLLEENLDKQRDLIKHDQSFIDSLSDVLVKKVSSADYPDVITQLKTLKIIDPVQYRSVLSNLVEHKDENVQELVVKEIKTLHLIKAYDQLKRIQTDKNFSTLKTQKLINSTVKSLSQTIEIIQDRKYITQLTSSKLPYERLYGALLLSELSDSERIGVLDALLKDSIPSIILNSIIGSQNLTNNDTVNGVINRITYSQYSSAVISVLSSGNNNTVDMLETAFELNRKNEDTQKRIVMAIGKIGNEYAVHKLLEYLKDPNHNIVSVALESLSKCGFTITNEKMARSVRSEIAEVCEATIWNMSALLDAKSNHCSNELIKALEIEIKDKYETMFRLLSLLYDPKSVESVKNNINSQNVDDSELASQLLDLFINDELKTYLIPLLKTSAYREKINDLEGVFACEKYNKRDLLTSIIFRDYRWMNGWTKTRALIDLCEFSDDKTAEILSAQLVNKNPILRETAAYSLLVNYPDIFSDLKARYNQKDMFSYVYDTLLEIENKQTSGSNSILRQEIAEFLSQVKELNDVSGVSITTLTRLIKILRLDANEVITTTTIDEMNYYFIYEGTIQVDTQKNSSKKGQNQMIHPLGFVSNERDIKLTSEQKSVLFYIPKTDFENALYMDEAIAKSILSNCQYSESNIYLNWSQVSFNLN
ncbi:MFS transporter [Reichenbachiella versicolor]|uniref:MFS transporter n=1 Tax=Reichenbachiella versicolor TaxID=1821036 RepID=UPI0013A5726A|nr:MFS transporter [Reichenbachiella versicolor]